MEKRTTLRLRIFTLVASICMIMVGFTLTWIAFSILEPTPFNLAGMTILIAFSIGIIIWLFLVTVRRRSFKTNLEDLKKYHVEHKIGIRAHRKKI